MDRTTTEATSIKLRRLDTVKEHLEVLLKEYVSRCTKRKVSIFEPIKIEIQNLMEENTHLRKVVFNPSRRIVEAFDSESDIIQKIRQNNSKKFLSENNLKEKSQLYKKILPIRLYPLLEAMRINKYIFMEFLYIFGVHMNEQETAALAAMISARCYPITLICICDCLLTSANLGILATHLKGDKHLEKLYLDFNDFGDIGCKLLCKGLQRNRNLIVLSLRYCGLTARSGSYLGNILSTTAVNEVYLEGNDLGSEGVVSLISGLVDYVGSDLKNNEKNDSQGTKTKNKRNCSIIDSNRPIVKPIVRILSIPDVNLKRNVPQIPCTVEIVAFHMLATLIAVSEHLEELDLWNNDIGDLVALVILRNLKKRKEDKLPKIAIRVGPFIKNNLLQSILRLSK